MAGATSTVASLWPVADNASQFLMEEFYKALLDGLPAADALWRAKEKLRRSGEFADPRFWAPFEVFGPNAIVWPKQEAASDDQSKQEHTQDDHAKEQDEHIIIRDLFDDDRNHWQTSGKQGSAVIRNGRYEMSAGAGGWEFATIAVDIPSGQDFDLSCTMTKLRGNDGSLFGFVFGFKDDDNFTKFAISGEGSVSITSTSVITLQHYRGEDQKEVKRSNASNVLRIVRKMNGVRFLVNGTEAFAMPWYDDWQSLRLGFLVNQDLAVAFDDFKISTPGTTEQ
jgi:hypothetical protein